MRRDLANLSIVILGIAPLAAQASLPIVREKRSVKVGTANEVWRLEWRNPPALTCFPGTERDWNTCPCIGFEFAEAGDLDLVRRRPGSSDERFPLTPLFTDDIPATELRRPHAVLRRWPILPTDTAFDVSASIFAR